MAHPLCRKHEVWHTAKHWRILDEDPPARLLLPGGLALIGLVGGEETKAVRQKLIRLRVRAQSALRRRFERAKSDGDLPEHADAAGLADFITCVFQGMTVQAINGAGRAKLLRIAKTALLAWPGNSEIDGAGRSVGASRLLHP